LEEFVLVLYTLNTRFKPISVVLQCLTMTALLALFNWNVIYFI